MADKKPPRERYYDAPTEIRMVEGVQHKQLDAYRDSFRGTATALAQTGLLPLDQFPGRDGQNTHSAAFRPHGAKKEKLRGWSCVQGHMTVQRQAGDVYRIVLMVGEDERKRRLAREEAIQVAGEDASEAVLCFVAPHVREYIKATMRTQGGHFAGIQCLRRWFSDKDYLQQTRVSAEGAEKVLFGARAFELARERREQAVELERRVDASGMVDARLALAHALMNETHRCIQRLGDLDLS